MFRNGEITDEIVSERIGSCRRRDYIEHIQLRLLQPASDSDSDADSGSDSDSSDDDDDDDDEYSTFPITHEFGINCGSKKITSLALNRNSTEFVVGSQDSTLKFYNYNQLQLNKTTPYLESYPFTEDVVISEYGGTKESGNYLIKRIVNDRIGDNFLVIPNHSIFKVLNSQGQEVWSAKRGDVYIQDYSLTKGHINDVEDGIIEGDMITTCSKDATIRKWNLAKEKQESVAFFRDLKRLRGSIEKISKCGNSDNSLISSDSTGKISIYDLKNLSKPLQHIKEESSLISLIVNEFNKNQIITRSTNDEIKIYDLRKFTSAVLSKDNFYHTNEYQNLEISNNGSYLIGSTVANSTTHQIQLMEISDLSTKYSLNMNSEPTCLKWDHNINQILVGDIKGNVSTLFSDNSQVSQKGIKLIFNKAAGKRKIDDDDERYSNERVISYNSEDLAEILRNKQSKKPKASFRPQFSKKKKDITVFAKNDLKQMEENLEESDMFS